MKLNTYELTNISGGGFFTASMINALARAGSTIFEIGQSIGSSFRRMTNKTYCPIN